VRGAMTTRWASVSGPRLTGENNFAEVEVLIDSLNMDDRI
jgi:hypothetical protein